MTEQNYKVVVITERENMGERQLKNAEKKDAEICLYAKEGVISKKGVSFQLKDKKGDMLRKINATIENPRINTLFGLSITNRAKRELNAEIKNHANLL